MHRIKKKLKIGYARSVEVYDELVDGGVLKNWDSFVKSPMGKRIRGNIIWKNIGKYRVPKIITERETARVSSEKKRGLL